MAIDREMPNRRYVEVAGVNFVNKGALLMLEAVIDAVASTHGQLLPVLALRHGGFRRRAALGLGHLARLGAPKLARVEGAFVGIANAVPGPWLRTLGIVRERDVHAVLDASGFLYSDQWGERIARSSLGHYNRWKRDGRKLVLLPQAFGPFEGAGTRAAMSELLGLADLVYARDRDSLRYLESISGPMDHVRLAPDFTNLLEPRRTPTTPTASGHVVFVPNMRMIDMGHAADDASYVRDFVALLDHVGDLGFECTVVVHEANDRELAARITAGARSRPACVDLDDPREIKAVLTEARLVVSSRFHALVSSLAQGVPSIAVGWSHKYRQLLADYGSEDCLGASMAPTGDVTELVVRELADGQQLARRALLAEHARRQKRLAEAMWADVLDYVRA